MFDVQVRPVLLQNSGILFLKDFAGIPATIAIARERVNANTFAHAARIFPSNKDVACEKWLHIYGNQWQPLAVLTL